MLFPPRLVILLMIAAILCGCTVFKRKDGTSRKKVKPVVAAAVAPQRVGSITLVNEAEHFVLIDTGIAGVPPLGTALRTFTGEASSGIVTVGNVNRRPFAVADIVQGAPRKGDAVFQ